ncbi:uncharacterized protein PHACADRAFT_250122 [Phanerochaete carnosa HHB-10118-sp]|uniref:SH3 domain-containing protein n=1 Tax=Phanerochaete carnosa (strain HHB-10118-sp) TaxID=650164 RepID=K5WJG7_PHACS|nr:uncharacterized protein PHACADRAFT_250122 [Phanerochaete carnosa HHB-10118-sp]EKM59550.1 hypothetical protein PHACADRAFT_250122 [Phanerochaete carnosa HHB-10118-sp]
MVFAGLDSSEKDAFFTLLDEYFASRPDVFGSLAGQGAAGDSQTAPMNPLQGAAGRAATSAIHNAFTTHVNRSPELAAPEPAWKRTSNTSSPEPASASVLGSVGRVAAAASMFKSNPPAMGAPPPRPPPRKISPAVSPAQQYEEPSSLSPPSIAPRHSASPLFSQKKFGDVDLTSGKNMYLSVRHGTANKQATPPPVAPPVPAALSQIKNTWGAPPRRVPSTSSQSEAKASPPPPPPPRPAVEEPEPEGEWAEAIYEYSSDDPGDLPLQEGQRVLIIERTSDDWWTGVYEGRRGLVPASYIKVL